MNSRLPTDRRAAGVRCLGRERAGRSDPGFGALPMLETGPIVWAAVPELLYSKFTRKEQTLSFEWLLNGNYDLARILIGT